MQDVVVGLWGGGGPSTGLAGSGESSFESFLSLFVRVSRPNGGHKGGVQGVS